jgi:predicted 3-demethylubiquinone-9 3-methyltransferase (glyoxalase superfamily)
MSAPSDFPGGEQGTELTVDFTVLGRSFVGLNGGPNFTPNEAVSFMVVTEDQEETDLYWDAITKSGGEESACGWCKDRWGFSWQITPRVLLEATTDPDRAAAKRAMEAMMTMVKIDIATIEAARRGEG